MVWVIIKQKSHAKWRWWHEHLVWLQKGNFKQLQLPACKGITKGNAKTKEHKSTQKIIKRYQSTSVSTVVIATWKQSIHESNPSKAPDGISDALQIPGIIVFSVVANSPAEKAGVRPMLNGTVGDVITTLDDKPIRTGADIFKLLDKHAAELNGMRKREKAANLQPLEVLGCKLFAFWARFLGISYRWVCGGWSLLKCPSCFTGVCLHTAM